MKRALICTVYNEAATLQRWIEAMKMQTIHPDEFVVVDGGSSDNTVQLLRDGFADGRFPMPQIIVQRCNIAEGRNIAIRHTTSDIIAGIDASAFPDADWLDQVTRPFAEQPGTRAVGGRSLLVAENDLQRQVGRIIGVDEDPLKAGDRCSPSSRNIAFTRAAWQSVGGYPEWLTLTAEDALFNANLEAAGFYFYYQPAARVTWEMRPNLRAYLKMMRGYGFGSAEMGQAPHLYRRWLLTTLVPPVILFSPHPLSDAPLRYLRNAAAVWGWIEGLIKGRKPPPTWKWMRGTWLSPETQATIAAGSAA